MRKCLLLPVLFAMSACATLSTGGQSVKVVDPAQLNELATCKEMGVVTESSEMGTGQMVINLKNATAQVGANVVVSRLTTERAMGILTAQQVTKGKAFSCPQAVMAKLHGAEDFGM